MTHFVALVAAVLFAWSCLLYWCPWQIPGWARPLAVVAMAAFAEMVPPRPLEVIAAAGAVGVLYYFVER